MLAVTTDHGIPIHHRILSGSIVSVSTVKNFVSELMDLGIETIMIVMDRGFYSKKNILDLKRYSLIGDIPATLTLFRDLLSKSKGIENSRNYIPSGNDTIFHMEHSIEGTRYIVFFSTKLRAEKVQAFYSRQNIQDLRKYSLIGAIPATLSLYVNVFPDDLISMYFSNLPAAFVTDRIMSCSLLNS